MLQIFENRTFFNKFIVRNVSACKSLKNMIEGTTTLNMINNDTVIFLL